VIVDVTTEGEAQEAAFSHGIAPQVRADQCARRKAPCRLLARLADHGGQQRLAIFQVACGLVEQQPAADALFDDQESVIAHHDCGDGDIGLPGHRR